MKNLNLFFLLFLLLACDGGEKEMLVFPEAIELEAIEYSEEIVMGAPWSIKPIGDKLMLFFPSPNAESNRVIDIMDVHTGQILDSWGRYGGGPGEFSLAQYWGADENRKRFYLYDIRLHLLREYQWKEEQGKLTFEPIKETPFRWNSIEPGRGERLDNGNFISSVFYGIEKPVLMMDSKLDSLAIVGDVPDKEHKSITMFDYDGKLAACGNCFAFAMSNIGCIGLYEQLSDGQVKKRWVRYAEKPLYKGTELNRKMLKNGFGGVAMTDKYIFATYSGEHDSRENRQNGRIYPETILMFDYKGNLLYNFHTPGKRQNILAVSEDGKTLYAEVVYPEIEIVRYDISRYVK